jgi:hypothetical protein
MPRIRAKRRKVQLLYGEGFGSAEHGPDIKGGTYIFKVYPYTRKNPAFCAVQPAPGIDKVPVRRETAGFREEYVADRVKGTAGFGGQLFQGGFKGAQSGRGKGRIGKKQPQEAGKQIQMFRDGGIARVQAKFRLGNDFGDFSQSLGAG